MIGIQIKNSITGKLGKDIIVYIFEGESVEPTRYSAFYVPPEHENNLPGILKLTAEAVNAVLK